MTSSQFERIPSLHSGPFVLPESSQQKNWKMSQPSPDVLQREADQECVIANGYPLSPLSSTCSTPGDSDTDAPSIALFDLKKVSAEQIAVQLTLIDLEIFQKIGIKEFSNSNWTKKEKHRLAPNIVAFTRRFNHTSFLVVREILNETVEKSRAETIAHFIKTTKRLFELNNLHSLKAVVSALQSTPIYRLHQTWKLVSKKDRATLEKMTDFLSSNENWKILREHMDEAKLPCIPHLGLYLTDLCFLQGIPNKGAQVESTINLIAYCQNSSYDSLYVDLPVRRCLTHVRYIDELQKFHEEDNYKLSLKYEPSRTPELHKRHTEHAITPPTFPKPTLRTSKSHEDLLTQQLVTGGSGDDLSSTEGGVASCASSESPFAPNQRNTFLRRSLNTPSSSSRHHQHRDNFLTPSGGNVLTRHKLSVPSLTETLAVGGTATAAAEGGATGSPCPGSSGEAAHRANKFSSSVEVKRKAVTLPREEGGQLLWPPEMKPRSASDYGKGGSPSLAAGGARHAHSHSLQHQNTFTSGGSPLPHKQAGKKEARGHKKSQSLGSNVLAMFGVSKPQTLEVNSHDISPDPPLPVSVSLLDDSLLDDTYPFTPTGSIGNVSTTSGGSSRGSLEDFAEGDHLYLHSEEREEAEGGKDIIKEGFLKRKTLRHNGNAVWQLRGRRKCWVKLISDSIIFMEAKPKPGKKQSKPIKMTCVMLKECRLKHRDPAEKLTDEQFIINDDDGNSTKFTAKSVSAAMQWVVAIKEAIRVQEEKAREEAERSLIKL